MNVQRFSSAAELSRALADRLIHEIQQTPPHLNPLPVGERRPKSDAPFAIMLAGGRTPLEAYRLVAERRPQAGKGLHVLFSDERHVPGDSPESNCGQVRPLLDALGVRVLRVHTELPVDEAAERWDDDLADFFQRGGTIPFGLLGLGADGHTASLFSREDIERGVGRYAIPVTRPTGPARISVTPQLLKRVGQVLFVVVGADKAEVVERLLSQPDSLPAGLAVAGAASVGLYYAP